MSIAEVLRPRAQHIAELVSKRVSTDNQWYGYDGEELEGELRDDGRGGVFATYWRKTTPDFPKAVIGFSGITLKDVLKVSVGEKVGSELADTEDEREERYQGKIVIPEGVDYKQDITHTFQKTTSLSEAVKLGAELAVKATANASYAGIGGSVELAAKITAEYDKTAGETKTMSDTITRSIDFSEPGTYTYEAVRTVDDFEREITATTDFDHTIYLIDERDKDGGRSDRGPRLYDYEWRSVEEFLSVAQGLSPSNVALYYQFINNKATDEEVSAIKTSGYGTVSYIAHYNNVKRQDITISKKV